MSGLPGVTDKKGFFQKKWAPDLFDVVGGFVALIPVGLQAWNNLNATDPKITAADRNLSYLAFAGIVIVCGKGVVKLYQNIREEQKQTEGNRLEGIEAGLEIIHSIVRHMHNFDRHQYDRLRVTLYRVAESRTNPGEKELEQIVEYVGSRDATKRKGRRFSIRCGLIGKVARSGEAQGATRETEDNEAYLRELEVEWNFTRDEAVRLSSGRNSFFAVPITYGQEVTAVVYLDSSQRHFFPDNVKRNIIVACLGLAVFINRRYYND